MTSPVAMWATAVEALERLKAQLTALEAAAAAAYDTARDRAGEGHRSTALALRHRNRMHGGEAASVVALARALRSMPHTASALVAGAVTANHARPLARAAARPEFAAAETFLVGKAVSLSYRNFERAVSYWVQVVDEARDDGDPEPPDPRERNRALHLSTTMADMGRLDGWLFTGALRQAICARDRTCDHDGCEIPARHCEIDHNIPWDSGGHTNHHNGKARCSYHHRNGKPRPG